MKRVWHRLFNLAARMSLAICVATVVLWVRSYWRVDDVAGIQHGGDTRWTLRSMKGEFLLVVYRNLPPSIGSDPAPFSLSVKAWNLNEMNPVSLEPLRGIGALRVLIALPFSNDSIWIGLGHWMLVVLSAALPTCWLVERQQLARRRREGLCRSCGYDLRATPNRCPECGTVPTSDVRLHSMEG